MPTTIPPLKATARKKRKSGDSKAIVLSACNVNRTKGSVVVTKKTIKRRRQLAYLLNTKQNKCASNTILGVRIGSTYYTTEKMRTEINHYVAEQILLGDK